MPPKTPTRRRGLRKMAQTLTPPFLPTNSHPKKRARKGAPTLTDPVVPPNLKQKKGARKSAQTFTANFCPPKIRHLKGARKRAQTLAPPTLSSKLGLSRTTKLRIDMFIRLLMPYHLVMEPLRFPRTRAVIIGGRGGGAPLFPQTWEPNFPEFS